MARPRRVLAYARVSSAEQALGTSLRDQQDSIARYAKSLGSTVTKYYVEAESAIHEKIERREQIRALMNDARAGDLVVCDKLDRWSRDTEFTLRTVRELREKGASFYSVADQCDPSTRDGDMMLTMRAMFAKEEHRRIRERMVGTRQIVRNQGYYVEGTPPLGYRRAHPKGHKGIEKNVLVIVKDEAEIVRRIFKLYVGGQSMEKIAKALEMKIDRVKDALHRRLYIGEIQDARGEWMKGRHEAIVDVALFMRAQETIAERTLGGARPRDAKSETSDWILRDVARCAACGSKMGSAYAGPKERRRYYYKCNGKNVDGRPQGCKAKGPRANTGAYVPVRDVETAIGPMVVARLAELREHIAKADAPAKAPTKRPDLAEKRAKIDRHRERFLEAFADELITREELRERLSKLDAERTKLHAQELVAAQPAPLANPKVRREMLARVKVIAHAWKSATAAERREIVNTLASGVAVGGGREPRPTWKTPEDLAVDVE